MNDMHKDLAELAEKWYEAGYDLEDVIGAAHVFVIQCETALRIRLVASFTKGEDDAE